MDNAQVGHRGPWNPWQHSHYKWDSYSHRLELVSSVSHDIFVKSLLSSYFWPCHHHLLLPSAHDSDLYSLKKRSLNKIPLTFCYCSSRCKEKGAPSCWTWTASSLASWRPWTIIYPLMSLLAFPHKHEPWSNFSHLKNTLTPKQNPPTFSSLNLLQSLPLLPISPVKYHQRLSLFKFCFFTSQTLLNPLHLAQTVLLRHHPLHWLDPHAYSILLSRAHSQQASQAYHKLLSETFSPWAATGSERSYPFFYYTSFWLLFLKFLEMEMIWFLLFSV